MSYSIERYGKSKTQPALGSIYENDVLGRPLQSRPRILHITPLNLDEIQRQIEEADKENTFEALYTIQETDTEQSEGVIQKVEDSNEINLPTQTPAKQPEKVTEYHSVFVTPATNNKFRNPTVNRALEHQYVTPKNKIPTKVQCSVKVLPVHTPTSRLCSSVPPKKPSNAQLKRPTPNFKQLQVNDEVYFVLNQLGKGGSSEVFHCYNCGKQAHRAIKVVSLENHESAIGFVKEVEMLRKLQDCNRIIKMFDYEIKEKEKILLVVLEVGGTDLSKILKESVTSTNHMPVYRLLYYWMEMLYAVKQMHSRGIIHSDLKPANFLKVEGYLKLIDFGIASCVQSDMTGVFKTVPEGSFNYISPEALNNVSNGVDSPGGKAKYKLNYKSDVWSLGCILYQLVYLRTPFQHITNMWSKIATITNPDYEIEFPNADWVPQKILKTVKCCLQYKCHTRSSVDELISEYKNMFHRLS